MKLAQPFTAHVTASDGMLSTGGSHHAAPSTWHQKMLNTLVRWQHRADQRRHLGNMDDRLLADMGITRADAIQESRKPFWIA